MLALVDDGYRLLGVSALPIAQKTQVETVDAVAGLDEAVCALSQKDKFGALTALYVRKSSAELNLEEKK